MQFSTLISAHVLGKMADRDHCPLDVQLLSLFSSISEMEVIEIERKVPKGGSVVILSACLHDVAFQYYHRKTLRLKQGWQGITNPSSYKIIL